MHHFIVNHTEPNTTVAEWKAAVKKSFGLNYYNDMTLEILEQYATFYWVYELQEQYMYGSSRLGSVQRNLPLVQQVLNSDSLLYYSYSNDSIRYMERGQKRYELSNHLGNVLAVVSDRKLVHCSNDELMWFEAHCLCRRGGMVSVTVPIMSGYPFGMEIKERSWSVSSYRPDSYRGGFNGMEQSRWLSGEVKGSSNSYDFGARIYDSRLGKWLSLDPLQKMYPSLSTYGYVGSNPIVNIEADGRYFYAHTKKTRRQTKRALRKVFGRNNGFSFNDDNQLIYSGSPTLDNARKEYLLNLMLNELVNNPNQHIHIKEGGLVVGDENSTSSPYITDKLYGGTKIIDGIEHPVHTFSGEATVTVIDVDIINTTVYVGSAVDVHENGGFTSTPVRNLWHGIGHGLTNMLHNRSYREASTPVQQQVAVSFDNFVMSLIGKKGKNWQPRDGTDHGSSDTNTRGTSTYWSDQAEKYSNDKYSISLNLPAFEEKLILGTEGYGL
jgi:RHS repeat-associated protein